MEFRILGPLEVEDEGRTIPLAGAKQRSLLALLLLARGRAVSTDRLIDEIWDGAPPERALKNVQVYVSQLRTALGDGRLIRRERGYELKVAPGELDADRFDEIVRSASGVEPEVAAARLHEALALFRGDPLSDLSLEPWAQPEIARLEERRLMALEARIDADLSLGRHRELVPELDALVAAHPFREHLLEQLVLALYRSGRQAEALDAYRRGATRLRNELGLEPGRGLQELEQRILRQDPMLDPPSTPAARGQARRRGWKLVLVGAGVVLFAAIGAVVVSRESRQRRLACPCPARRRDHRYVERPSRCADSVERDQVSGARVHGERQLLGVDPRRELAGADRSERRASPRAHQLTVRRRHALGPRRWPQHLVQWDAARADGHRLGKRGEPLLIDERSAGRRAGRVRSRRRLALGGAPSGRRIAACRSGERQGAEEVHANCRPPMPSRFGDGGAWVVTFDSVKRVDAATNTITNTSLPPPVAEIAVGGGFAWVSNEAKGTVYKIDRSGRIVATYETGDGARDMSYADGTLWVVNQDVGTVTGIDAATGARRSFRFGHPLQTLAALKGKLLVSVNPGRTYEDRIDALKGKVARLFGPTYEFDHPDPAISGNGYAHSFIFQAERATCAPLLGYPDAPPPRGQHLVPEVAAAMPTLSRDRRTYTFAVRRGFRFAPPSNAPLDAQTFRFSIERALNPKLGSRAPGIDFLGDLEGAQAFHAGRAAHVSGIRVRDQRISFTLTRPSADFLERLALPYFCPVPRDTLIKADGVGVYTGPAPAGAGPYSFSGFVWNGEYEILKRNPNYGGSRPQPLDAIAFREGIDTEDAVERVERGAWTGIQDYNALLAPSGEVARRFGAHVSAVASYRAFPQPVTTYLALNARSAPLSNVNSVERSRSRSTGQPSPPQRANSQRVACYRPPFAEAKHRVRAISTSYGRANSLARDTSPCAWLCKHGMREAAKLPTPCRPSSRHSESTCRFEWSPMSPPLCAIGAKGSSLWR